jgi:hypothetical protein
MGIGEGKIGVYPFQNGQKNVSLPSQRAEFTEKKDFSVCFEQDRYIKRVGG